MAEIGTDTAVHPCTALAMNCRTECERAPAQDEQVGQNVDHIGRVGLAGDADRQTIVEHPILASIVGAVLGKKVATKRRSPSSQILSMPYTTLVLQALNLFEAGCRKE